MLTRSLRLAPLLATAATMVLAPGHSASGAPLSAVAVPAAGYVRAAGYVPAGTTLVATMRGTAPGFARPGGPRSRWVPGTWHTAPSVLPVIARKAGWVEVRLAQRPNGSTAWVRARDVTLSTTPYAIVVSLGSTRLSVYRDGRPVLSAPAGVGSAGDPTPAGQFFVAFRAAPPGPGYGSFVLVTSAHSDVLTDWQDSGDAMVAIHGPLGADAQIGTAGARISHGCIRLHLADLIQLSAVPPGTPVTILPG